MKYKFDEKTGLKYRENTLDLWIIKEQNCYNYLFEKCKGKVVLDIGSNIGAFINRSLKAGAKKVYGFEPEKDNFMILKEQNFDEDKVRVIKAAVSKNDGKQTLYLNKGRNKGLHSLNKVRGREEQEIKTISFKKVIQKVKPDLIKIDIEGGEYNLNFDYLNDGCKIIAIEIHFEFGQEEKGDQLLRKLRKMFKQITYKEVPHYGKRGTGLFIGRRK